jgi:hypothetical protein
LLSAAIDRARDLPGRVADARQLSGRLHAHRALLERRLVRVRRDAAIAAENGSEFCQRRAMRVAAALSDEIAHADALIAELTLVRDKLRRERRSFVRRIDYCERVVRRMPEGVERDRLLRVIDDARASVYTLTRGDAKH